MKSNTDASALYQTIRIDIRLGQITYTGTTWGTLPFTSFNNQNSFDTNLKRYPAPNQNFTIALTNQGLRANISCQDVPSSPLSMATTLPAGSSPLPCNPDTPIATISPDLRMRAGYCNSSTPVTVGSTSFPSYDFYMRFTGDYIHFEPNGEPHNENITCRITPFVTVENSAFMSTDNSTWVERNRKIQATGMYPQALVERILGTLVDMMTVFGQNSIGKSHKHVHQKGPLSFGEPELIASFLADNLIAEQFVQITTSYFNGTYTSWPLVAQRQLEGMFAFVSPVLVTDRIRSHIRLFLLTNGIAQAYGLSLFANHLLKFSASPSSTLNSSPATKEF